MSKIVFQIMGGLVLSFGGLTLVEGLFAAIRFFPSRSRPLALFSLAALIAVLALVGVGLLYLRKWAALGICILTLYGASLEIKEALQPTSIPGDWNWLGFVFGALLLIPSIFTAMYWRTLVWRRRRDDGAPTLV